LKLLRTIKEALGIGPSGKTKSDGAPQDRSTQLAIERTDLALERTYRAAERTLMAWVRTALSMISFGFTIGKLGEALGSVSVKVSFRHTAGIEGVAYFLVVLGTLSLIVGAVQNRIEVVELFRMGLKPRRSLAFFVAVLLGFLGTFAFTALVIKL
jgi:putative membrane protein